MVARTELSQRRRTPYGYSLYSLNKVTAVGGVEAADAVSLDFGTGDFSVAVWCKWSGAATSGIVIGKTPNNFTNGVAGWHISRATSPDDYLFEVQDGSVRNFTQFNVGVDTKWHLLVATREGTTARVYVDGVQTNTETEATYAGDVDNNNSFVLFNDDSDTASFFGSVGASWVWKGVALSAPEIATLYFDKIVPQLGSLSWEGLLTEGSGTTTADTSGNGNTGTFAGSVPTWETETP